MATPLIANVKILQEELENGMLAYNHTLPGRTVSLREGFNSGLGGFMHSSYSCDILIRSKDLFDRVVDCAGVFASQKWLTERPLPAQLTPEEVHRLRFYYEQVIEKFEAAIEKDWTWVKELDANWIAAVKARVSGVAAAEGERQEDDVEDEEVESSDDQLDGWV